MLRYRSLLGDTDIGSQNYDIGVAPISGKTPASEVARIQMLVVRLLGPQQSIHLLRDLHLESRPVV